MKGIKSFLLGIVLLYVPILCNAELRDSLDVTAIVEGSAATRNIRPLWSYSNAWGRYTQYDKGAILAYARASYGLSLGRRNKINLRTVVSAQGSTDGDRSMIHEAYFGAHCWFMDLTVGLDAFTPIATNNGFATGSYIMSDNARPYPRIGAGILDYWTIPYLFDLLQIKGGVYFGLMDDEGNSDYTSDFYIHEKFVYFRSAKWFIKPYIGLIHSAMFGGMLPDGREIPIDFWATFFARNGSSEKFTSSFRGEATNRAGGHQGIWDLGVEIETTPVNMMFYYNRPIADKKALTMIKWYQKDIVLGAQFQFNNCKTLHTIYVEYFNTRSQNGPGTADPVFVDKNGTRIYVYPGDITEDNLYDWIEEHISDEDLSTWESEYGEITSVNELYDFFHDLYNNGYDSGRSNYLCNGAYRQGWTRGGLSMGTPLFHTIETVQRYAGEGATQPIATSSIFANVRVRAYTITLAGEAENLFNYRLRLTYSRNYGSYLHQFDGSKYSTTYSWDEVENYYFKQPKNEFYTALWLDRKLNKNLKINAMLAYDFGQMYKSFALRFGLSYSLNCL